MGRRTEQHHESRERPQPKPPTPSGGKKRKPRGPLFHSGDPTLAERLEEEVYSSRR